MLARVVMSTTPSFFPVFLNRVRIESHLIRVDDSVGDLETHHELSRSALVTVKHTNIFQIAVTNDEQR